MAERVLTTRELNRAALVRQHLLEPSTHAAANGGLVISVRSVDVSDKTPLPLTWPD